MALRLVLIAAIFVASSPAAAGSPAADLRRFAQDRPDAVAAIAKQIQTNETGGRDQDLITWLQGEAHLSLGIGHFIWYPADAEGPFTESFTQFLTFIEAGALRRRWPTSADPCPWPNRMAFQRAHGDPRLLKLRTFIERTIPEQTAFLIERLAQSVPGLRDAVSPAAGATLERRLEALLDRSGMIDPDGVYALTDYVNFKGEGLAPGERYQGEGWGLLQVLLEMDDHPEPKSAFARAAARVLERRVALSPPGRHESRWLPGWRVRVATYARGLE